MLWIRPHDLADPPLRADRGNEWAVPGCPVRVQTM
jgi:hypothetical protein